MTRRVISVSGPPGAGKSTLLAALSRRLGAREVLYDDFEVVTSWPPDRVEAWLDNGAPIEGSLAPGLYEHLISLDGIVLLETPFGRACPQTGPLIDVAIWLECPLDVALARKLSSLAHLGREHVDFPGFLSGWLWAYQRFTRRALLMQCDRVKKGVDTAIPADASPEKIVSNAFSFLNQNLAP